MRSDGAHKIRHVIIAGPTASGKTELALQLAGELNAEIISADSMMVYRFMDIGTAKPDAEQRTKIPHHLIDILKPDEHYDAALFRKMALEKTAEISGRGRSIFIVGGTGLYLRALERGLVSAPARNRKLRDELHALADDKGLDHLYGRLLKIDPDAEEKITPKDRVRIIRALEIYHGTGIPATKLRKAHGFKDSGANSLFLILDIPREKLRDRIRERARWMISNGLIEEVETLKGKGYNSSLKAMQALNYRHAWQFISGTIDLHEMLWKMEKDTWHFARRQMNWFRSETEVEFVEPNIDNIKNRIEKFLNEG